VTSPLPDPAKLPLSLYIHVPWCVRKCPYCDFNSHENADPPEQTYLEALLRDLDIEAARADGRTLQTIFIGGGTPSLMSAHFYDRLLAAIDDRIGLADNAEITLEANPGASDQARFDGYREAGINRLSIGVQSLDADKLAALGRIHDPQQARDAVGHARRAGFERINLDLMHGLPGQTSQQALDDLARALDLGPDHLSWYELTLEPNTAFWSRPPALPDPDQIADTEDAGFALLADAGFRRYEISAFAHPDQACRHNLNYWQFGDYLALGAGAHGKITGADGRICRYQKTRQPDHYLNALDPTRAMQALSPAERALEFFLNGLRLIDGVARASYAPRTGNRLDLISEDLSQLVSDGLLTDENGRLACTALGIRHLNSVLARLEQGLARHS
jgi:oxygen-independent coproporphyrinogen-3 oxidase